MEISQMSITSALVSQTSEPWTAGPPTCTPPTCLYTRRLGASSYTYTLTGLKNHLHIYTHRQKKSCLYVYTHTQVTGTTYDVAYFSGTVGIPRKPSGKSQQ